MVTSRLTLAPVPKGLLIPDVQGWAYDNITRALTRWLKDDYELSVIYHRDAFQGESGHKDFVKKLNEVDFVVFFSWLGVNTFAHLIPENVKVIITQFDHFSFVDKAEDFKKAAARADLVLCGNESLAKEVSNLIGPEKVRLGEDGVDTDLFSPLSDGYLAVGWTGKSKSFFDDRVNRPDVKGFNSLLRPTCDKLPFVRLITQDIDVSKKVEHEDMPMHFYRLIDVYACLSLEEGTPNPGMEALSMGIPVISTKVGLMPKILKNGVNGWLIDRNVDSLESALREAHRLKTQEPARWKSMQEAARASIIPWDWKHKAQQYAMAFDEILYGGKRRDLSGKVTLFVISVGDPSYQRCIEALDKQNCPLRLVSIINVAPMDAAFQRMLDLCETDYFIEVDEDMILLPGVVPKMVEEFENSRTFDPKVIEMAFPLFDAHLERTIVGCKIYYHPVVKKYPFKAGPSCEMGQAKSFEADGYKLKVHWCWQQHPNDSYNLEKSDFVGYHGTSFTKYTAFERYANLFGKHKQFRWMDFVIKYPKIFMERYVRTKSEVDLYAFLGSIVGMVSDPHAITGEKDYHKYYDNDSRFNKVEAWVNDPKFGGLLLAELPGSATRVVEAMSFLCGYEGNDTFKDEMVLYLKTGAGKPKTCGQFNLFITTKCNMACSFCRRQHIGVEMVPDMDVPFLEKLYATIPTIKSMCIAGFGEPLMCSNFEPIVDFLASKGTYMGLITNGILLTDKVPFLAERKLGYVSVSLNACTAEKHRAVSGTDSFDRIVEGMKCALDAGINLGVSMVVSQKNYTEMPDFIRFCHGLGVKFANFVNTLPHYSLEYGDEQFWSEVITDENKDFLAFQNELKEMPEAKLVNVWVTPISKTSCPHKCESPFRTMAVDSLGRVSGCRRVLPPGADSPLFTDCDVFNGGHYIKLRQSVLSTDNQLDMCKLCFGNWSE